MIFIATFNSDDSFAGHTSTDKTLAEITLIKEVDGRTVYTITEQQYDELTIQYDATLVSGVVVTNQGQAALDYANELILDSGTLEDGQTYKMQSNTGVAELAIGIEEYATFSFNTSGVVSIRLASDNVVTTDIAGKICLLNVGNHVEIKNRLGADKTFKLEINYT